MLSLCPVTTSFLLYAAERQGLVTTRVFVRPFSFSPSQTTLAARRRSQAMPPKSEFCPGTRTVSTPAKEEQLHEPRGGSTAAFSLSRALGLPSDRNRRHADSVQPTEVVAEKKAMLGRPSNNLQVGVVGMPNVGKSSLFNILSRCGPSICNAGITDERLN